LVEWDFCFIFATENGFQTINFANTIMKKYLIALTVVIGCIVAVAVYSACTTENVDNPIRSESQFKRMLVGKWTVYSVEDGYTQTILGSEWTYDVDGNFTNSQGDWSSQGIYHWDGNELIMTIDNQPWSAVVKEITPSEMIWLGPNTGKIIKLKRQ
jgi:hypothetical protein